MVNRMLTSELCPTSRKLYSEVSQMQIEWKEIEFGPVNLWTTWKGLVVFKVYDDIIPIELQNNIKDSLFSNHFSMVLLIR
jgi:hypothetical protein